MRTELPFQRKRRLLMLVAVAIVVPMVLAPGLASAEGLFDFLFGGMQKQQKAPPQANFFADPFGSTPQPAAPSRPVVASSGPAFCVRSCDGKYFPLMRGSASPVQMCQAFCPASPTKVFFGSNIDGAYSAGGERYADSENAFEYRKTLRADCTCNGRDPAGLCRDAGVVIPTYCNDTVVRMPPDADPAMDRRLMRETGAAARGWLSRGSAAAGIPRDRSGDRLTTPASRSSYPICRAKEFSDD